MVVVDSDVESDIMSSYMMWIYSLHVERNRWYEFYLHVISFMDMVTIDKLIEETPIEYYIIL